MNRHMRVAPAVVAVLWTSLTSPGASPFTGPARAEEPPVPVVGVERTERAVVVSEAHRDPHGTLVHTVDSPYQAGKTQLRILLPDSLRTGERCPVVYVLPVEALNENRYGDGLLEVRRHNLPNKFRAIFVAPTFSHLPWYADHPTNPEIRQESYFLKVVVPFVGSTYPVRAEPEARLLLGFSKSGWGAYSLLLRHPETFGKVAAWDAPLMMERPGRYGSGDIFGTQENFERYQVASLLKQRATSLRNGQRLSLMGYDNFRRETEQAHALMTELGIPHVYKDGPKREHVWESGWVPEAVESLLRRDATSDDSEFLPKRKPRSSSPKKPTR